MTYVLAAVRTVRGAQMLKCLSHGDAAPTVETH
jgi:hypothetical protein